LSASDRTLGLLADLGDLLKCTEVALDHQRVLAGVCVITGPHYGGYDQCVDQAVRDAGVPKQHQVATHEPDSMREKWIHLTVEGVAVSGDGESLTA
jgi:hypothetical protein